MHAQLLRVDPLWDPLRTDPRFQKLLDAATGPDAATGNNLTRSLAVLPFANLSDDPTDDYFASGIHDDVLVYRWPYGWSMVVNAANREKIVSVLNDNRTGRQLNIQDQTLTTGMLAKALGIEEGAPERKALTAEIRALMDAKVMYRTAGGRYRLPRSK